MDWAERENQRFIEGTYKNVPWAKEEWWTGWGVKHYTHVSTADPTKLAFTMNVTHGEQDRQTRMKPGKYLKKYFGDVLDAKEIQRWAGAFAGENENIELKLATTSEEIVEVYANGPHSCMKGESSVRVFGAGDLAVAYLGTLDDASARVLCWPHRLIYGPIYGDSARLSAALESAGYSEEGSAGTFNGAKLLRIADGDGFVGPYLDDDYNVNDKGGEYLEMSEDGEIDGQTQGGVWGEDGRNQCEGCNERLDEGDECYAADAFWCDSCHADRFAYCEVCGETCDLDDYVELPDGTHKYAEYACKWCADEITFECERCDERKASDNACEVGGDIWCTDCAESDAAICEQCEEMHTHDDGDHHESEEDDDGYEIRSEGWYCDGCQESHEKELKRAARVLTLDDTKADWWAHLVRDAHPLHERWHGSVKWRTPFTL